MATEDIVRKLYATWQSGDRAAMDALLAEDFHFSSPRDNRIDKAKFWTECWSHRDAVGDFVLEQVFARGDEAFVRYVAKRTSDGGRFRNTEFIRVKGERVVEVEVFFGRDL